jgi:hypothetical protein
LRTRALGGVDEATTDQHSLSLPPLSLACHPTDERDKSHGLNRLIARIRKILFAF